MMAGYHAKRLADIGDAQIVAAVDVRPEAVRVYSAKFGIGQTFATVDEALAWGEFDAVHVVTPDAAHHPAVMPCVAAGKHVLCEKPLAPSFGLADEMASAAEAAGVVAMVNLTYRRVAALESARTLVREGAIGQVRHIEASYLQSWLVQPSWGDWRTEPGWLWRLSTVHGSLGVLGDVGVHLLDFACHGADVQVAEVSCRLQTFDKAPGGRIGEYVLDANDSAVLDVRFANGALGALHATRWAGGHVNDLQLRIYGERGGIEAIDRPSGSTLRVCSGDGLAAALWREVQAPPVEDVIGRFVAAAQAGDLQAEPGFRHAAGLQRVLDLAVQSAADGRSHAVAGT